MMALQEKAASFYLLIRCCLFVGCLAQQNNENMPSSTTHKEPDVIKVQGDGGGEGVEEEVLGPLRVWHIVFLVGLVIVIAVTVFCCCVEWRIPRTRQEIEETYRRRQLNQKYLHQLERTPDLILRNNNNNNNSSNNNSTSGHGHGEDSDSPDRTLAARHHHHHHHQQQLHHHNQQRASYQSQDERQHRQHHHHQQQQQQQQQHTGKTNTSSGTRGVAMTEASARLARIARSQVNGVKTPFGHTAIAALQKQRQGQPRQPARQQT